MPGSASRLFQSTYAFSTTSISTSAGLSTRFARNSRAIGTVIEENPYPSAPFTMAASSVMAASAMVCQSVMRVPSVRVAHATIFLWCTSRADDRHSAPAQRVRDLPQEAAWQSDAHATERETRPRTMHTTSVEREGRRAGSADRLVGKTGLENRSYLTAVGPIHVQEHGADATQVQQRLGQSERMSKHLSTGRTATLSSPASMTF